MFDKKFHRYIAWHTGNFMSEYAIPMLIIVEQVICVPLFLNIAEKCELTFKV